MDAVIFRPKCDNATGTRANRKRPRALDAFRTQVRMRASASILLSGTVDNCELSFIYIYICVTFECVGGHASLLRGFTLERLIELH